MDTLTITEFSSTGYASVEPLVSPNVLAVVTIGVLTLALFSKTVTFASISSSYVLSSTLTLVSTVLFFILRVAIGHIISLAVVSYTTSALIYAWIKMREFASAKTVFRPKPQKSQKEQYINFYHHIWFGRTQAEAENEVQIIDGHYKKACEDYANLSSEIQDLQLKVQPMGQTDERTDLEARIKVLTARLSHVTQIKDTFVEVLTNIKAAYDDATNNGVFKEGTSIADFSRMELNVKSVTAARYQINLKKTYGERVFDLIMGSVKRGGAATDAPFISPTSAKPKARATSVARIKNVEQ